MAHQEQFRVMKGTREGRPVLLSVDVGLLGVRERWTECPWFLAITIPLREPNEHGLCDPEEADRLNELEDALLAALEPSSHFFVGHMTWRGEREVWLYVTDQDDAVDRLNKRFRNTAASPEITVTSRHDPAWEEYLDLPGIVG